MKISKGSAFLKYLSVFGSLFLFLGFFLFGATKAESEVIKSFNANIDIQKNGSLVVTETIIYDFGSNQKHGIFRDIPLTSTNGPQLSINVFNVSDEVGEPYQYTTSVTNNVLRIKIGDPNVTVSGVKTYVIGYRVYNAIRTFNDHDELYWNVTGNQWPVAIQDASALVRLPDFVAVGIKMDCFTGPQGSTQKNCVFNQNGANISYSTTQSLNAKEGLTFVLGIPLGYIQNTYVSSTPDYSLPSPYLPITNSSLFSVIDEFIPFVSIFIIFFLFFIYFWFRILSKKTTKPKPVIPAELKNRPITTQYEPPDNLSPIDVGALLDRRVDIADISSVIINLAVRGYLKIRYTLEEIPFWPDKKDFEFVKLKDGADLTHPADKIVFNFLFNVRDSVKLSELKEQGTTFQLLIKKITEDVEQYLSDKGYFTQIKMKKTISRILVVIVAAYVGFRGLDLILNLAKIQISGIFESIFTILVIVGSILCVRYILRSSDKLTPQGISALEKILGFKEFLELTEKDKLELTNAPELKPEVFEKFLPYAMVLGVEEKWAKKFEGIYSSIPNWYEDPTAAAFSSHMIVNNLTLLNSSFNQVFNTASRSSGGFSSGFGGGGHSGGGSGGGGGGSW
ncbi:MAG: DUF2207 domain-containing protein [Patescibacteria group bacterium]|nr:DUF2207 domain-containing protein [Patescibacteria group bacterium]